MAYNLPYYSGGVNPLVVPDNSVATIAGVNVPGKNYLGYGQIVDQTILDMVEHFAKSSSTGPSSPIIGQIWFDTTANVASPTGALRYYDKSNVWVEIQSVGGNITANVVTANIVDTGDIFANNGTIGNLISGNVSFTGGNISGTNITGNIGGTLFYDTTFNNLGLGDVSGTKYNASANIVVSWNTVGAAKGNATGWSTAVAADVANMSIAGGTPGQFLTTNGSGTIAWSSTLPTPTTITNITTGAPVNPGTITGAWTLTPGSVLNATYADLAERHHSDREYPVGTVMTVGGTNEVTVCPISVVPLGVISEKYAYLMNSEAGPDETHPAIGYLGRVPVRVVGPINKHDRIAPAGNGVATAADKNSFGWALETNTDIGEKLVLCIIK